MRREWIWGVLGAVALLAGCETTQPKQFAPPDDYVPLSALRIESKFQSAQVNAGNLAVEAAKCVPQVVASGTGVKDTAAKLPLPAGTTIGVGHLSSASQFQITRSTGICLRQSEARYTILAAEAFLDTVNPVGVPPDVLDDWYKQIAKSLAESGSAKVVYAIQMAMPPWPPTGWEAVRSAMCCTTARSSRRPVPGTRWAMGLSFATPASARCPKPNATAWAERPTCLATGTRAWREAL